MALKDDWKKTGKGLGSAFKSLGKNIGRSVVDGCDVVSDSIESNPQSEETSNVFNDGSWRSTGKELGGAFKGLAHSLIKSAEVGIEKLEEPSDKTDNNPSGDEPKQN